MYKFLNNFKTITLMGGLMGLCLAAGYLIGGQAALLPALVIGAAMNLFAFFFSDKIALLTVRAVEVSQRDDPALWQIVQKLTSKANPPPRSGFSTQYVYRGTLDFEFDSQTFYDAPACRRASSASFGNATVIYCQGL